MATANWLELSTPTGETIKVLRTTNSRARRLRLTVTSGGARLSYPEGTHPAQVYAFLRKNADWLERKLDQLHLPAGGPPPLKPGVTTLIPLRGETVKLIWREGAYPRIALEDETLTLSLPRPRQQALSAAQGLLRAFFEGQIQRDISRLLARYCPPLGRSPLALKVRPMKSLWGSLSSRDCMTLDLALVLAPPAAIRYVVVHELCHLRVRNHSPRFWSLVASLCPDYSEQRDWLREHGQALKAELARLIHPPIGE